MRTLLLTALISLIHICSATGQDMLRFTTSPAISPDGSDVIFAYESDLWKVPAEGGTAVRLTGMDGEETAPVISPDGKWVAFSSEQFGNNDVYLMPTEGGEIRRLTYHQGDDQAESWDWDSKTIFFRSDRYNRSSVYAISIEGGTPNRLFPHYHNTVHNLIKDPVNGNYYFNESWESFIFPQRKKYKGPFNPDIKSYDPQSGSYEKLTDWEGKDMWPGTDRQGNLYFVSDEYNGEYNLYTLRNGEKTRLTSFNRSVISPKVSADGSAVVFEKEYALFLYDTESEETRPIPVQIFRNNTLKKDQSFNIRDEISSFDVSPDGKKLAMVSRGEIFVSDMDGKFTSKIPTNPGGRVLEVKWLSDDRSLIFTQTYKGYQNIYKVAADGSEGETQLTEDRDNNRALHMNSDRTRMVYLSGRNELRLMDLENFESETLVRDEFWGFQNQQPRFSPNDEYVLYTARRDFEQDIFTYQISSGQILNLTKTGVSENDPFWSPDGKYIYFTSTRTAPSYPRGGGPADLYRMALDKYDDPYRSEEYDRLFESENEEDEEGSEEEKVVEISINTEELMQRLQRIGENFGSQNAPYVIEDGDKMRVLYLSDHDEGNPALYVTTLEDFESPETKKVEGLRYVSGLSMSDGKLYGLSGGSVYSIDTAAGKATKIESNYEFSRNLRAEFDQMFDELWANIEENFYNETFHGIDWESIREQYREYLPYVTNRNDFRRMMNDMLGELNSSHMGFNTSGEEEEEFYGTVSLSAGLLFEENDPYVVSAVIKDGPADVSGKDIRAGDRLLAVDGKAVDPAMNRESYFIRPADQDELNLSFERDGSSYSVLVHPVSYYTARTLLYDEWVDERQQIVDERSDEQIAYVHMKNMGGGELDNFLTEMTSEAYNRKALILDLRYNTGGNVHDAVLQFLSQKAYATWKYREGESATQPNFTPSDKPIILLQNEQSLSDAEVTAAGFKALNLGRIVGTGSYRWIIFTSGKGLVDGSFYRLPSWGLYTLDEGKNLERTGVEPDIYIQNTFLDRLQGDDPQLQKAIELIMEELE